MLSRFLRSSGGRQWISAQKWSADSERSRKMIEGMFPEFSKTHFSTSQMPKKSQKHRFALKVAKLPEGPPKRYLLEKSAFAPFCGSLSGGLPELEQIQLPDLGMQPTI